MTDRKKLIRRASVRHMNFLLSARCRILFIRQLRGHAYRCESTLGGPETVDVSFKRLGVPASVAATLRAAFPDIQSPTKTQSELIPAILAGKDVLLRDRTGTGKYAFSCHDSVTNDLQVPKILRTDSSVAERLSSMEVRS
jgi:hypothetical protein